MNIESRKGRKRSGTVRHKIGKILTCIRSVEQSAAADAMIPLSESLGTKNFSIGAYSSQNGEADQNPDNGNIEEAELCLREHGSLNYEEARALLGRIEYQKGNIEAALHVFEGIDIAAVTPKMKVTLAKRGDQTKRQSHNFAAPPMSIHAVSLLLEAIFLKAKSLQHLGRFKEAAQSCKVILDIVESSLPEGLPENVGAESKLQENLSKAVELLPELWKLSDSPSETILSYRRALLHHWNLDAETIARIQKEFAVFLLYSGGEASPPNLRTQMDTSFVPKNNTEEAILLLMILSRKMSLKRIKWDASLLDHLSFALSVAGDLKALAKRIEELLPGTLNRRERFHMLALCYFGANEDMMALNLLRKLLHKTEDPKCVPALLMASQICGKTPDLAEEGANYARTAIENLGSGCNQLESVANFLLGVSLSSHSKLSITDYERVRRQTLALRALEVAGNMTVNQEPNVLYHLSLENAEQRKLDVALSYVKRLIKLESGSNIKGWLLLARILSAQKKFAAAESVVNAALDQTGKWDQGELLRTKAKLQIAQDQLKSAIETYTQLLALLQIQSKSFGSARNLYQGKNPARHLELEVWHDLALVYINLSRWLDAEICLSKSKAISSYSASRCHITGKMYEAKGLEKEALKAYMTALSVDPTHVPSLISMAAVLRQLGNHSIDGVRSLLMNALRLDRTNASAWYNLGLLYKAEGTPSSLLEAAECFEAASFIEETTPVEPFR